MRISKIKSCQGLTLIEVMIAGMILAFTLSAFVTSFTVSKRSAVMADDYMEKMHEARGFMERLVAFRYTDPEVSVGMHFVYELDPNYDFSNPLWGEYVITQNPTYLNTKDIVMDFSWTESGGDKTYNMSFASSMTESLHR